ncbi:MAG: gliding motility-associated C-terminal domain-containing protein [Bacteroidia bacterium]|nr:gliding motility-associated C-terminal domain-containing protein [Bacteroidia bacterium]
MRFKKLLFYILVTIPLLGFANSDIPSTPKIVFEENKSQWPEQVVFQADIPSGKLFLEKNTFTYLLTENVDFHDFKRDMEDTITVHYHSYKVNFRNSNPNVSVKGEELFSFHRNYYIGNDPQKWAEKVKLYGQVHYSNLYPKIDMHVYNSDQNLKYDFIVNPGGDPGNISMNYEGQDKLYVEYGHLYVQTSLGVIMEQKPYVYQEINGVKVEIPCSYKKAGSSIGFSINGEYDRRFALIIDPVLIASTYTGSTGDNWGFTATYDFGGNIYTGGIVAATGYPTTVGAFSTVFGGGVAPYPFDISLTKFNPTGSAILYSTYYGGNSNEQPHSLFVNSNNELYVAGRSKSANFPVTAGAFDTSYNGGFDIIVGKFGTSGNLLSSTFIGGTGDDGVNINIGWTTYSSLKFNYTDDGRSEILLDNNGEVYVAGSTRSTNFPVTAGAFDTTLGGTQDGCVFKMNSSLTALNWSTYLGGTGDDAAYGIKVDAADNAYVTGGTASADFPVTAGVLYTSFQGGLADAYITAISNTGTTLLYSTYLGTAAYDQSYLIEIDGNNDVYVYGQTKGAYPVTAGVYSNPNSGQFIHKVNKQLNSTVFSTVVGTGTPTPELSPTAFLVDSCQSIYLSGWGRCSSFGHPFAKGTNGLPVTANAYQKTTDNCDFYFMVLRPNAQALQYATFFGESGGRTDHVDGGTSRFDQRGFIYESVCASCGKTQGFPTTATAWSKTNKSNNCNNAVVKMDVQVKPLAVAGVGPSMGCTPFTTSFNNGGSLGSDFIWDFGDGSPKVFTPSPSHTYTIPGTYTASLFVTDSTGSCGVVDTAFITIVVKPLPTLATVQTNVSCFGGNDGTTTVTASVASAPYTYLWSAPGAQTSATASGLTIGSYTVTVTDNFGCSALSTVAITEPLVLQTTASVNTNVSCAGGTNGSATANPIGGTPPYKYLWSAPGGQTSATATNRVQGIYTVTVTDAKNCSIQSTVSITEPPILTTTAVVVANALCYNGNNGSTTVTVAGGVSTYSYLWCTSASAQTSANATGLSAGIYTVTVTDINGCTITQTSTITEPTILTSSILRTDVSCKGGADGSATITASGGIIPYTYSWSNGTLNALNTNLSIGIYTCTVTDNNNCSAIKTITISEPVVLSGTTSGTNVSCNGGNDGTATVSGVDGTSPYTYLWNNSQSGSVATGLALGVYTVTITDKNGCVTTSTQNISEPVLLTGATTFKQSTCDSANGTASINAIGGSAPYTYSWSTLPAAQVSLTATGLSAGTYTVTITDVKGCTFSVSAIVPNAGPPTATLISQVNELCFNGNIGASTVSVTGGTVPYTYLWSDQAGQTTAIATALLAGTYTVTATDANGCVSKTTVTITEPFALSLNGVIVNNVNCNGGNNGSVKILVSGGIPSYLFSWSDASGQTSQTAVNLSAGIYTCTVTDNNGCTSTHDITVTEPLVLSLNGASFPASCFGSSNGQAFVLPSGGTGSYSYNWQPGNGTSISQSNISAGMYTVTVTDQNSCTSTTVVTVSQPAKILPGTTSTQATCNIANGTASVSITGGIFPYTYLWNNSQTSASMANLLAAVYSLTVTDANGCTETASVIVTNAGSPSTTLSSKSDVSCKGGSNGSAVVNVTGGTSPYTYLWSDPLAQTTLSATNLSAGTYNVTVTDFNGCISIATVTIIEPTVISLSTSVIGNVKCTGGNDASAILIPSGGTPSYNYSWSDPGGQTSQSVTGLSMGTYTCTVTDSNGCISLATVSITEPLVLSSVSSPGSTSCFGGNDGQVMATPAGGTGTYTYSWQPGNGTNSGFSGLSAGIYTVTITDLNGCTTTTTATVTQPTDLMASTSFTQSTCAKPNGTATAIPSGATPPYSYLWDNGQSAKIATALLAGTYTVTITDVKGCSKTTAAVIVNANMPAAMTSNTDVSCFGGNNGTASVSVSGGALPYTYLWSDNSAGQRINNLSAGTYTVTITDGNNCTLSSVVNITQPSKIQVSLTSTGDVICRNEISTISSGVLGGTPLYTYQWNNLKTNSTISVSPVQTTAYIVLVADANGCTEKSTITITVNQLPDVAFNTIDTSGCGSLCVNFTNTSSNDSIYKWTFGDGDTSSLKTPSHCYNTPGSYGVILKVTSTKGCTSALTRSNYVRVYEVPKASFTAKPTITTILAPTIYYTDHSTGAISWLWNFGDIVNASSKQKDPSYTYSDTGLFCTTLMVTNQFGCTDTTSSCVEIKPAFSFYVPNAFTPDKDGINELWTPKGYNIDETTYKLMVFDRWGNLIWQTRTWGEAWDGKANNGDEVAQIDVYVWKVMFKDKVEKNDHQFIGNVTLLK